MLSGGEFSAIAGVTDEPRHRVCPGCGVRRPARHTSCIVLPAVMRWNKPVNADRQALIVEAMGHPGDNAADVLATFIGGLDMPRSLSAVNIGPDDFDRIA